jgi:hypothetical protein
MGLVCVAAMRAMLLVIALRTGGRHFNVMKRGATS